MGTVVVNKNLYYKDGTVGLPRPDVEVEAASDGEIWIRGYSVMLGYYKEFEATAMLLQDGWYATGDIGYVAGDG